MVCRGIFLGEKQMLFTFLKGQNVHREFGFPEIIECQNLTKMFLGKFSAPELYGTVLGFIV